MLPEIKEVNSILAFAKKAFTKGSFRCIVQYVNGLIALAKKTVKKISDASSEIRNQSELNYVLTESKFEQEILTKRYLEKIRYLFRNLPVYLIIDDTLVERNGYTVQEAQYHYDHNSGKQIRGHQFFTALLWTPILQLPIFPDLYSKNTDRCPEFFSNKKEYNKESRSEFEIYLLKQKIQHIPSRRKNPQTNGKLERLWQEYNKHRWRFKSLKSWID